MEILKFNRHHGPYTPGDVAGFAPDAAARLVATKIAEKVESEPEAAIVVATKADDPKRRARSGKADS